MSGRGALFGNAAAAPSRNLVEFKAGKMTQVGKRVFPDTRKGLLYVHRSDDSLVHFCWRDRATDVVEDDLIIFPNECEFKRVPECTTGRVYVLKFHASARRFFIWVQEPICDKDEANAKRINEVLNSPPEPEPEPESDAEVIDLMQNMTRDQLMHLVAGIHHAGDLGGLLDSVLERNRPSTPESDSDGPPPATRNPAMLGIFQGVLSDLGLLPRESDTESDGSSGSTVRSEASAQNEPVVPDNLNYALLSEVQAFFENRAESGHKREPGSSSSYEEDDQSADDENVDQRPSPDAEFNPSSAQPQRGVRRGAYSSDDSEEPPKKRKRTGDAENNNDDTDEDEDEDL